MVKYIDKHGNVAEIIRQIGEQVIFIIQGDDLERTWYWDEFIRVFNSIKK